MSPVAVGAAVVHAPLAHDTVDSSLVALQTIVSTDLLRPVGVAIGWTLVTLVVGWLLLAGASSSTRTYRDDTVERPDLAFAAGFVAFFAPLVVASLPLFVSVYVLEHPAVLAVGALVSIPALLCWVALLIGGGTLGAVAVGDRLAGRFGTDAPSLTRSLVTGSVVLGASQLVPVLGTLVALALATVGTGAVVRRRFDLWSDDGDPDAGDEGSRWHPAVPRTAAARATSGELETTDSRSDARGWNGVSERRISTWDDESDGTDESDEAWTVDDWTWETDTDREGADDGRVLERDR